MDEGDVIQRTVVIYHISDQFSSPFKQLTKKLEVSHAVVSYFQIRSFGVPLICSFSLSQGQGDGTSLVVSGVWSSGQLTFFSHLSNITHLNLISVSASCLLLSSFLPLCVCASHMYVLVTYLNCSCPPIPSELLLSLFLLLCGGASHMSLLCIWTVPVSPSCLNCCLWRCLQMYITSSICFTCLLLLFVCDCFVCFFVLPHGCWTSESRKGKWCGGKRLTVRTEEGWCHVLFAGTVSVHWWAHGCWLIK